MAKLSRIARPQTRFMQSNEIGEVAAEENAYGFNHAVRGYDPEEVDDYINNLFGNYKNTQNVLNKQKEEFETEREMLQCEINDLHGKNGALQEENDELKATIEELREEILALAEGAGDSQQSVAPAAPVEKPEPEIVYVEVPVEKPSTDDGSAEYEVLYAENNELIGKNRTLSIENAKLQKSVDASAMEAKAATDKLGEIQSRLDESQNKLADNQNKLEECQAQLEDSQVQLLETQEKVEEGQTRIQSMEEEMTQMRKKMAVVDSKELIDSLISSMGSLESVLKQRQE
ncbi:hypothetical protein N5B56_06420 [Eubacterium sp. LFL-14]|uniref:DivIVA domain-containing protein n=1 Tax=Eubacterium album TaxID=2978477 RepID=A0ABT2LZK3_9FIRM|nr:hypothetical protein [Eubacterium sp. LFL-14]MCT7398721.1 hypothetical protein [Eubacterium sp. LFL-14]